MKNKKGFTLIELLAVIVILAIIALIATPLVLKYIDKARVGAKERSAESYIRAAETEIVANLLRDNTSLNTTCNVKSNGNLDCDGKEVTVSVKGTKPTGGYVTFDGKKVTNASLLYEDGNNINIDSNGNVTQSSNYKEAILYGADPVLKGELVPVVYKNNKTYKADITKEWYNYTNKEWANAVILFDEDNYKAGDEIDESAIKEYYVWIPKYSYRLWNANSNNTNNVGKPIEIVFGSKAKTTGENNGDMYIHPAFENFGTQGIWVGKFETSYNEETFTDSTKFLTTNPNVESATEPSNLIIKPNVRSLTMKTVSEYHTLLFNSHRELNSHMMMNMEWGAAAYLTYSIYGRCDSETCTEVTNNNVNTGWYGSSALYTGQWEYGTTITGCAADNIGDAVNSLRNLDKINTYESEKGVLASTTGNITGIYDMSGGDWEYVMGVLIQPEGTIFSGRNSALNSGFKGIYGCSTCDNNTTGITENTDGLDFPDKKYYNAYTNNYNLSTDNWYDYSAGLLGDATKEVANTKANSSSGDRGNWFNDYAHFATPTVPWIGRGGAWYDGTGVGVFYFYRVSANASPSYSSRLVLAY